MQYLKRNNTNHPLILETTPRALETPFHRSSIFSSQSLDGVVDNQDIIFQEPDQAIIELLEDTNLSCLTAVEILNDILSYDKLEASDMKLNYSVIDVKSLLERCVAPFAIQVGLFLELMLNSDNRRNRKMYHYNLKIPAL